MLGLFDQPDAAFYEAYGLLEPRRPDRSGPGLASSGRCLNKLAELGAALIGGACGALTPPVRQRRRVEAPRGARSRRPLREEGDMSIQPESAMAAADFNDDRGRSACTPNRRED